MTVFFQNLKTIFPDVPRESPAVDSKGNFTDLWSLYFGDISQSLQNNFKNEGIVFPPLSATNMSTIQGLYTSYIGGPYNTLVSNQPDISGQTLFDSTTLVSNQFIIAQDGSNNVTLAEWVPFQMTLQNAGNPDLTVAGILYWLCYDTANGAMYICTTAGGVGVARWTQLTAGSGGGVLSVSGTANRITSSGGPNPVIDIAATYVGQTSITTLGTVTTGAWNGSIIPSAYGGTGINNGVSTITIAGNFSMAGAYTFVGNLTGNTSVIFPTTGTLATTSQLPTPSALTKTDDTNVTLTLGGSPSVALLAATSITAGWTGTLSGARGGTGVANTGLTINLGSATAGYVLTSDVSGNATWAANPGSGSITTINGNTGSITPSAGVVTINGGTTGLTTSGSGSTLSLTGTLVVGNGGTGLSAITAHYLPIGNGTSSLTLLAPSATSGVPLISQGASSDPTYGTAVVKGGGTGNTTFTAYSVICAGTTATGAFQNVSGVGTSSQVLVSNGAGALPSWQSVPGLSPAALTKTDDTNVTLTLGGSPSTALLQATSITAGWTGVLAETRGGTNQSTYTLGDTLYSSAANTLSKLAGNITTTKQYLSQTGTGAVSAAPAWATISGSDITGAALTKADDTNVTLTLGGAPTTALLRAASITAGWTGQLSLTRGGSNASLTASNGGIVYSTASAMAILSGTATANLPLLSGSSTTPSWGSYALNLGGALTTAGALTTSGAFGATFTFTNTTSVTFPTSGTLATTSQIPTGAALTKTDDTNVTLTLGGSPTTALVNAASITAGWTGTLSGTRGGTGVNNGASTITIGGNVTYSGAFTFTGTITANTSVTFPTSGTLATTSQILVWSANSNTTFTAAVGNGYILTSASPTTVTLPTTFAVGQQIAVSGQGAAWTLALGASTNIKAFGNTYTTSLASTDNNDSVILLAIVANTTWTILDMKSKGLTAS